MGKEGTRCSGTTERPAAAETSEIFLMLRWLTGDSGRSERLDPAVSVESVEIRSSVVPHFLVFRCS
jgi:hypothetical protein